MRVKYLIVLGLMLFFVGTAVTGSIGYAWDAASIAVNNREGRKVASENGVWFTLDLSTSNFAEADSVKSIVARNTDPSIDSREYTDWIRFTEIRAPGHTYTLWTTSAKYTGQRGTYEIVVTYQNDTSEVLTTKSIKRYTRPIAPVTQLWVDYSTPGRTPVFRFIPVNDSRIDYYRVRIRYWEVGYWEDPDWSQARMLYRTAEIREWTPGRPIEVAFLQNSDGRGTGESLVPGVEYEFRVEAYDEDGASDPPSGTAYFRSNRILYFCVSNPYEKFAENYINKARWRYTDYAREISSGKLILKDATPSPAVIMGYPYDRNQRFSFTNPSSISSIEADATILDTLVAGNAHTRVRLEGIWYNDGTSEEGSKGDIWAHVSLSHNPGGIGADWYVARYLDPEATQEEQLGYGTFTTQINVGQTYRLYIGYDSGANQFTFRVGDEEIVFDSTVPYAGNANISYKSLRTRARTYDVNSSAHIAASFDNVYTDDLLYDDFSSPGIDPSKWTAYDQIVREISSGKLRSKVRSASASTSSVNNTLDFGSPLLTESILAKVTPLVFDNPDGANLRARVIGRFYNDGTPGGGYTGDVGAQVRIGGSETSPTATWAVWKHTDASGSATENVENGTFTTPISLGNTYTLSLAWDGTRFVFKIDDEEATYTPAPPINPPNYPWKAIGTQISSPEGEEATLEALFDDVRVNVPTQVRLISPNGGEEISSSTPYTILWEAPPEAVKFDLSYSLNNGKTWNSIKRNATGTSYSWRSPDLYTDRENCLVKVKGYRASGKVVGQDTSDAPFRIVGRR